MEENRLQQSLQQVFGGAEAYGQAGQELIGRTNAKLSLLAHITYFDRSPNVSQIRVFTERASMIMVRRNWTWRRAWENDKLRRAQNDWTVRMNHNDDDSGVRIGGNSSKNHPKTSDFWREHVYACLLRSLLEMEHAYDMFGRVVAVVNTNAENAYLDRLAAFARANLTRRVTLQIRSTPTAGAELRLRRPWAAFNISWQHRAHMRERLEAFDWFMYTEEDNLGNAPGSEQRLQPNNLLNDLTESDFGD